MSCTCCVFRPKKLRASSKSLYAASYAGEVEKVLAILRELTFRSILNGRHFIDIGSLAG